jgi:hypothetical protein
VGGGAAQRIEIIERNSDADPHSFFVDPELNPCSS